MNFLHIHTTDIVGGAAISMYRLHQALQKKGQGSRILCGRKFSTDLDVKPIVPTKYGWFFNEVTDKLFNAIGLQAFGNLSSFALRALQKELDWAQIILLKNIHGHYLNLGALPWLSQRAPIIWRLADMWPFTGHCAYSYECERWLTGCGHCPHLREYPALPVDTTHFLWQRKKTLYSRLRGRLVIVSPSQWLLKLISRSPLLQEFPAVVIPSAVNLDIFRPGLRAAARETLGLRAEEKVVMFSAVNLHDERKGAPELLGVLERLARESARPLTVLTLGHHHFQGSLPASLRLVKIGFVSDDRFLALCYNAADVYLSLSRADNLPNTLIEAAACGLPVITLDRGGCAEAIDSGKSGYAVADSQEAGQRLVDLLKDDEKLGHFSRRAREVAQERFGMEAQGDAYIRVAGSLVSSPSSQTR